MLAGVESALRTAYAFEARGLTEPVFLSELVAAAHTVPGVLAVDVDHLYTGPTAGLADRLLAPRPDVDASGEAIPAGVLVLDPAPFDELEGVAP